MTNTSITTDSKSNNIILIFTLKIYQTTNLMKLYVNLLTKTVQSYVKFLTKPNIFAHFYYFKQPF